MLSLIVGLLWSVVIGGLTVAVTAIVAVILATVIIFLAKGFDRTCEIIGDLSEKLPESIQARLHSFVDYLQERVSKL